MAQPNRFKRTPVVTLAVLLAACGASNGSPGGSSSGVQVDRFDSGDPIDGGNGGSTPMAGDAGTQGVPDAEPVGETGGVLIGGSLIGGKVTAGGSSTASTSGGGTSGGTSGALTTGRGSTSGQAPDAGGSGGGRPDAGTADAGADDAGVAPINVPGTAPYDTWTFIPIAGAFCANGSPTGIMVNPHAGNENLTVYFAGGGACWSYATCGGGGATPLASNLGGFDWDAGVGNGGIFYRGNPDNPFANDNFMYVPYCTGDVHGGSNVYTYSDGGAGRLTIAHVGYTNVAKDLEPVVATIPHPKRLVVVGSSAGGYGALFNYAQVRAAFPAAPAFLIDDSGPPLRPPYGSLAWYAAQAAAWGMNQNVPAGCPECSSAVDGGGLFRLFSFYAQDPSFRGSLLETTRDGTISFFYSVPPGNPSEVCVYSDGGAGPCQFQEALWDLYDSSIRDAGPGELHVYFVDAGFHTFLGNPGAPLENFLWKELGDAGPWTDVLP